MPHPLGMLRRSAGRSTRRVDVLPHWSSPAFIVIKAADAFKDKTTAPNQLWPHCRLSPQGGRSGSMTNPTRQPLLDGYAALAAAGVDVTEAVLGRC